MDALIPPYQILYPPHCLNEILQYKRNSVLGRGSTSNVFNGILTGKLVAVKRIPLKSSLKEDEFRHQMKLKHENVLALLAVFQDIDFR